MSYFACKLWNQIIHDKFGESDTESDKMISIGKELDRSKLVILFVGQNWSGQNETFIVKKYLKIVKYFVHYIDYKNPNPNSIEILPDSPDPYIFPHRILVLQYDFDISLESNRQSYNV